MNRNSLERLINEHTFISIDNIDNFNRAMPSLINNKGKRPADKKAWLARADRRYWFREPDNPESPRITPNHPAQDDT
jgi:hypothetical protein